MKTVTVCLLLFLIVVCYSQSNSDYKGDEYKEPKYEEEEYKEPEKKPVYKPPVKKPVYKPPVKKEEDYQEPKYEEEYKEPEKKPVYKPPVKKEEDYQEPKYEEEYKEPEKKPEYKPPEKKPVYKEDDYEQNYEEEYEDDIYVPPYEAEEEYKPPVKYEEDDKQCYCPKPDGKDVYYVDYNNSYHLKGGKRLETCYEYYKYANEMNYVPPSGWYWCKDGYNMYCDFSEYDYWFVFAKSSVKEYDFHKDWNQYEDGWKVAEDSFWQGFETLYYYCNINQPCEMWIRYCSEYLLCYDLKYSLFWVGSEDLGYVLYWSGIQPSYEHQYAASHIVKQNVQKWSTRDRDTSNCASDSGAGWYATDTCKGLRWTSRGLCLDLEDDSVCYKDWYWKVKRYTYR